MLFGSLAWRDPTPQSHIDLMAIYDNVGYRQRRKRQRELATLAVRRCGQRRTLPLEWLMGQSGRSGRLRTASATGRLRPGPRPAWWNRPADDEPPGRGILSVGDLRNGGAVAYARG